MRSPSDHVQIEEGWNEPPLFECMACGAEWVEDGWVPAVKEDCDGSCMHPVKRLHWM